MPKLPVKRKLNPPGQGVRGLNPEMLGLKGSGSSVRITRSPPHQAAQAAVT